MEALEADVPAGMTLPELALRFILANPDVTTVIPGMRRVRHVEANLGISDGTPLEPDVVAQLGGIGGCGRMSLCNKDLAEQASRRPELPDVWLRLLAYTDRFAACS